MEKSDTVAQTFNGEVDITIPNTAPKATNFILSHSYINNSSFIVGNKGNVNIYSPYNTSVDAIVYSKSPTYPQFVVTSEGNINGTGINIQSNCVNTYNPKLSITYNINSNKFQVSTESYMNHYYGIQFNGSSFSFDGGDMYVNGKITCKEELKVEGIESTQIKTDNIIVKMDSAADYVFEDDYKLYDLNYVEQYVRKNKHLPNMPSAEQMKNEGMNVAEMNNLLLQKMEELTLYMI